MSDIQFFSFVLLPLLVVAVSGMVLLLETRRRKNTAGPDLFAPRPRRRSLANSEGLGRPSVSD
ncbi:hypothetical protein [Devosia sp.]|uniref:hypothetical protein n=1 Tax=Devosia sp. TaxID=1871048 RepID=UPI002EE64AA6